MQLRTVLVLSVQLTVVLILSVSMVAAQSTDQCQVLLSQALANVATKCLNTSLNEACYGSDFVSGGFSEAVPEGYFTVPGDVADLTITDSIDTSPASFPNSNLGLSLLHVEASLPQTPLQQHALYLVFGGQEIEDGVGPNDPLTPMQSFYLPVDMETVTVDANPTPCMEDVQPMVFIQGLEDMPVDLVVYGIPIRIESTIVVRLVPSTTETPEFLEFVVLVGQLRLNPGTPNEILVPAGFTVRVGLINVLVSLGTEGDADEMQLGTEFSPIRALTDEEITFFAFLVDSIPGSILNYAIVFPPQEPITEQPTTIPPTGGTVVGGTVPVTPVCSNFALTSPLQGMAYGVNTVYWNPAIAVTGYVVTLTNLDNGQSSSVAVGPGATNAQVDSSTLGGGFNFQLSVAALGNAGVVCQDVRTMLRAAAPDTGGGGDADEPDDDECPPGQQPSGVGGACIPIP